MAERKPVRVLDLMCGHGPVRDALLERYPNRSIVYTGVDSKDSRYPIDETRLAQNFHKAMLNLGDPESLRKLLHGLEPTEQWDEIHLHMPFDMHPNPKGPKILAVLASRLNPGGKVYSLFQQSSPLLNTELSNLFQWDPESFRRNKEALKAAVEGSGLRLHHYAQAPVMTIPEANLTVGDRTLAGDWLTRIPKDLERWKKTNPREAHRRMVTAHTSHPGAATHLMVLRKPRE